MSGVKKPKVPDNILRKWQDIVNLLAQLTETPAVLITQVRSDEISLLTHSNNDSNPFKPKGFNKSCSELYCDSVVKLQKPLLVEDARQTKRWQNSPEKEQGMTFYLGYPLTWPDAEPFGTICVMDRHSNNRTLQHQDIIEGFGQLINNDLMLLMQLDNRDKNQQAMQQQLTSLISLLDSKSTDLNETHTALRVLLRQQENERKQTQTETYQELTSLIEPYLNSLEADPLSDKQQHTITALRQLLQFSQRSTPLSGILFSANEQRIIQYIQANKSSKEIADAMCIAKKTVDFHRQNIRKKLNINNASVNLNSFLKSQLIF